MKFEIKHRWSGTILFSVEAENWRFAVEAAIKAKADLSWADLSKADLSEANLSWADLSKADLSKADLSEANLSKADLSKADLSEANLSEANLSWADLSEADLSKANLSWADLSKADLSKADLSKADLSEANLSKADLSKADLSWANLSKADLSKADLSVIRNDFWSILLFAQPEIAGLRDAIINGKIDGSVYEGECACLVGTIAKTRKCKVADLKDNLRADSSRPAERFFMGIKPGDTPDTNLASKIALEWLDMFVEQINRNKN